MSETNSPPETTKVLYGNENIQRTVLEGFSRVNKALDGYVDHSEVDQPLSHAIITNSKPLVEAQQYLFETLWAKAIPAQYKIKEIEEGIKPDFIETIRDPAEIQQSIVPLIKSAKEELLLLFSTPNAVYRQSKFYLLTNYYYNYYNYYLFINILLAVLKTSIHIFHVSFPVLVFRLLG